MSPTSTGRIHEERILTSSYETSLLAVFGSPARADINK